jgi:hypothetical protein
MRSCRCLSFGKRQANERVKIDWLHRTVMYIAGNTFPTRIGELFCQTEFCSFAAFQFYFAWSP